MVVFISEFLFLDSMDPERVRVLMRLVTTKVHLYLFLISNSNVAFSSITNTENKWQELKEGHIIFSSIEITDIFKPCYSCCKCITILCKLITTLKL